MKEYTITSNDADQRLDRFLCKLLVNASKSLIYKLNRKGNIKVLIISQSSQSSGQLHFSQRGAIKKGKKQPIEYKLQVGDIVQVFLSDSEIGELLEKKTPQKNIANKPEEKLLKKDLVYEDEDIFIVNKNPGQNVHPGDHATTEVSLIDQVQDYFGKSLNSLTFKPSLIHRIDRDTSGIIMIAKNKQALMKLSSDFKTHKNITKTYFCIVLGKLSRASGTITKKLKRIENAKNENKVQVSESGLEAVTHYKLLNEYRLQLPEGEKIFSTLEVVIETGRMHQIRVHMAALGNPIVGDKAYGNKKLNSYLTKNFSLTRHMLHAHKISFHHPIRNKKMNLEAKLKKDMIEFINILKK